MRFQGQEDKGKAVKKENHSSLLLLYISELCWLYTFRRFDVTWIKKNKCIAMLNLTSHLLPLFRG